MTSTVYYEASGLLLRGLKTSILRVVRQVARASREVGPELDIQIVPIVALGDRPHRLAALGTAKWFETAARLEGATNDRHKVSRPIKRRLPLFLPAYGTLSKIYTDRQIRRPGPTQPTKLLSSSRSRTGSSCSSRIEKQRSWARAHPQ